MSLNLSFPQIDISSPLRPSDVTIADSGLGTTFERWALNSLLTRLRSQTGIRSLLEGPGDGMAGISGLNSLILGLQGVHVTLILPHSARASFARKVWDHHSPQATFEVSEQWQEDRLPFKDGEFDLAWNFNVMTRQDKPEHILSELRRVSRKYILIFVPNRLNYSFYLHRLHHHVSYRPWDHGRVDLMHPRPWWEMFSHQGLKVVETIWLDCPWWPDIVDFGQLISDFFPFMERFAQRARPENRLLWPAERLPYYQPDVYPEIHRHMRRLAYFETSRLEWLKKRFAHHVGILGVKG